MKVYGEVFVKKSFLGFIILAACALENCSTAFSSEISYQVAQGTSKEDENAIKKAISEVSKILPQKFIQRLPKDLEIAAEKLGKSDTIPTNVCEVLIENHAKKGNGFIYGTYNEIKELLVINRVVLAEILKGREKSKKIDCQHKTIYDQAIATFVHELTHSYDFNNDHPSSSPDYMKIANLKLGLLGLKNKNLNPMRSADVYEAKNERESYAVNMEYFVMDPEYKCRRPTLYNYFKNYFESELHREVSCQRGNKVLLTSAMGLMPIDLDFKRVYRIDYLLASPGKALESGFGHSMLRLVMCAPEHIDKLTQRKIPATPYGEKCLQDRMHHLVISYRANVEDVKLDYIKGFFGGYPSRLFVLDFPNVLNEYNRDELRDLETYPLNLNEKEKRTLLVKIMEEHWNYSGDYKFVTNNCAVEVQDLIKSVIKREGILEESSVTPSGVLKDLIRYNLTANDKNVEVFAAKTNQIINSFNQSYNRDQHIKNATKKEVWDFIYNSDFDERVGEFVDFKKQISIIEPQAESLRAAKKTVVQVASFSALEQQILYSRSQSFRKNAMGKLIEQNKEGKSEVDVKTVEKMIKSSLSDYVSKNTYGIPFDSEIVADQVLQSNAKEKEKIMEEISNKVREMFKEEFQELDRMSENVKTINGISSKIYADYRSKLKDYLNNTLVELSRSEDTRKILEEALNSDNPVILNKVRELLGNDLITTKEFTDKYIKSAITKAL